MPGSKTVFDHYQIDLGKESVEKYVDQGDTVIHLAWRSNPAVTGEDVEEEMALNWPAFNDLVTVCAKKHAKIVFVSSGGTIYGKPNYIPIDEGHPKNPISAYGKVKLKAEDAIREAHKRHGLSYVIVRPSNLYGPGFSLDKGLGVIGHWVEMVKHNQPLKMIGAGLQTRDFIHVEDLCNGLLSSIHLQNETINLGSGIGISLKELSGLFQELSEEALEIIHLEDRNFDVDTNVLSIEKVSELTGWKPAISLKEGISRLLSH